MLIPSRIFIKFIITFSGKIFCRFSCHFDTKLKKVYRYCEIGIHFVYGWISYNPKSNCHKEKLSYVSLLFTPVAWHYFSHVVTLAQVDAQCDYGIFPACAICGPRAKSKICEVFLICLKFLFLKKPISIKWFYFHHRSHVVFIFLVSPYSCRSCICIAYVIPFLNSDFAIEYFSLLTKMGTFLDAFILTSILINLFKNNRDVFL